MNILSIGGFSGLGESNTCILRDRCLQQLGHVDHVDTTSRPINLRYRVANKLFRLGLPIGLPDLCGANEEIVRRCKEGKYDLIWVDKGVIIKESTFKAMRSLQPDAKIIGYSPDWMCGRHNQSYQFLRSLPHYDCFVTTKSYSVNDLMAMGCHDVYFVGNSFQEGFHKPYKLDGEDLSRFSSDVSFIGSYEHERAMSIKYLADNGVRVDVWGSPLWRDLAEHSPNIVYRGGDLLDESFCKAISGSKISLCFLRKINRDLQTTRTVEIPACGTFMLAERTDEHRSMFEEDKEAVYFSSNEELLAKCRYYLEHDDERERIASAGHRRCVESDYSNLGRIKKIINHVIDYK